MKSTAVRSGPDPEHHATDHTELSFVAASLERRLASKIETFEQRYELASADLERALRSGQIRETAEVNDWWISYRTLSGLADERKARPE